MEGGVLVVPQPPPCKRYIKEWTDFNKNLQLTIYYKFFFSD